MVHPIIYNVGKSKVKVFFVESRRRNFVDESSELAFRSPLALQGRYLKMQLLAVLRRALNSLQKGELPANA
ncbi:hypothetical protein ACTXT7_009112 [Hymenolepis weldensis]